MNTARLLVSAWSLDPLAVLACAMALGVAVRSGWRRSGSNAAYLFAAAATVVFAVASPIGAVADGYLFSAHMLQHLLLLLVAPPLGLMGLPPARRGQGDAPARPSLRLPPTLAWGLGVAAMWLWHAPTLCNAASQSALVHRAQEGSLLLLGTTFWMPIVGPRPDHQLPALAGVAYLFTACVACTVLGVIVTFSPVEVCSVYLRPTDRLGIMPLLRNRWGLTPERDQQLGGLLMWVPACLVYLAGILGLLSRWYRGHDEAQLAPRELA
jgi:cytochrome c oxidase assembly factor CtaG